MRKEGGKVAVKTKKYTESKIHSKGTGYFRVSKTRELMIGIQTRGLFWHIVPSDIENRCKKWSICGISVTAQVGHWKGVMYSGDFIIPLVRIWWACKEVS
jgi:hypothetical protein